MTHGYTRHFLIFSASLVFGAAGTVACQAVTSEVVESRYVPSDDHGDGGYESEGGGYESEGGGYESEGGGYESEGGKDEYDEGCTLTQGYWKNHNKYAKNVKQNEPWPLQDYEDRMLCKTSWLENLETPPKGDAWFIATHQWIAAKLNMANEASAPAAVKDAVKKLDLRLAECYVKDEHKAEVQAQAKLLDDYNNGVVGPGHCGDIERYRPNLGAHAGQVDDEHPRSTR